MSKVIRLFNQQEVAQQALISHIEKMLEMAKSGEITSFAAAAKLKDGNVATGYCNLNVAEKQEMVSHIQIDIMYDVMKANMDRLVEYV